jgi:hypothetical protein
VNCCASTLISPAFFGLKKPHLRDFCRLSRGKRRRPDLPRTSNAAPFPDQAATAEEIRLKNQAIEPRHVPARIDAVQGHRLRHGFSLEIVLWETL